ncbi:hypothetical protein EW146_g8140 [Bondarzewia mesenterica]|uniref:Protein kinase domain-containing protein n=1 Tax=Bondarzewia mesenterica TaxID=1095465 RepID=A0A4S4LGV0_9AGAM|nr:hypothetical protein EW146_g8140 [Bondarzewia mesenterica]
MASSIPSIIMRRPQTIQEWRHQQNQPEGTFPRHKYVDSSEGYTLWKARLDNLTVNPANDAPRTPDGLSKNSIHCPARTTDNCDVLIRLMAIGQDRGERHRMALSRLATGNNALRGENHVVPVLKEVVYDDMVFAIFPLMWTGLVTLGGSVPRLVFGFCAQQGQQGTKFCHDNLVAHLGIDSDNILINWVGGQCLYPEAHRAGFLSPFRSYLPIGITSMTLNWPIRSNSDPSSRVVTGLPTTGIRSGEYGRDIAPEMLSGAPYCPFHADVWQLGTMFKTYFGHLDHLSQSLVGLFDTMCSGDPASRPSVSEALQRVQQLELSRQTLLSGVPDSEVRLAKLAAEVDAQIASREAKS